MLGALYALGSAATFGLNAASVRRGVISATVFQALAITVPIGVPLFFACALAAGQVGKIFEFSQASYIYLTVAGMIHFVWGRYCGYRSTKALGANLAGPIAQSNMIVALTAAMIVLDEHLTPIRVLGLVLILLGPAIMVSVEKRERKKRREAQALEESLKGASAGAGADPSRKPAFEPNWPEGILFGVLAATGYGVSPVLVKLGLDGMTDVSFAAGFVSYLAATFLFCLFLLPKGKFTETLNMDRKAVPWFLNSGLCVFLAQMFRYLALSIAPVTVVAPITRCSIVFRTIFSTIISRDHEVINLGLIVGILLALSGAVMLSLSMDVVAAYVDLPPALMEWRWP